MKFAQPGVGSIATWGRKAEELHSWPARGSTVPEVPKDVKDSFVSFTFQSFSNILSISQVLVPNNY